MLAVSDPGDARPLKLQVHNLGVDLDDKVGAATDRFQVSHCGRTPTPVDRRRLEAPDALLCRAIEIIVTRDTCLDRSVDEGIANLALVTNIRDLQGPTGSVKVVGAVLLVLRLLKERQNFLVAPALVSKLAPVVVVLPLAANVDQAVYGA